MKDHSSEFWDILLTVNDRIIKVNPIHVKESDKVTLSINNGDPANVIADRDMIITSIRVRTLANGTILYTFLESNE